MLVAIGGLTVHCGPTGGLALINKACNLAYLIS